MESSINPQCCFTTALFSDMQQFLNMLMETSSFLALLLCEFKQYVKKRDKALVHKWTKASYIKRKSTVQLKPAVYHSVKCFKLLRSRSRRRRRRRYCIF